MKLKISFFLLIIFIFMIVISGCVRVKCGDGVCHAREERRSSCPQDCEEQIVQPPIKPHEQPSVTSPSTIKPADYKESITVDNRERTYILHIPTGYTEEKEYPLVLVFHGGNGDGERMAGITGFSSVADREEFIVVYPNGIEKNWNDGRGTTDAELLGVDDKKFVRELIMHLKTQMNIDEKRIYVTGTSNGGVFSHRLGCEMADVFAAIGPEIASMPTKIAPTCNPSEPISVVVIQGKADPFIKIEGGDTKHKTLGLGDGGLVISADEAMKLWASKNGCESAPTVEKLPIIVNDGTQVEKKTYSQCRDNTEVIYYLVEGMGHTWPPKRGIDRITGPTSQNIDATEVIWRFFEEHLKN